MDIKITHTVFKNEDIEKYLSEDEKKQLQDIKDKLACHRIADGKKINNYIICNQDEPYADGVLHLILLGEERKVFCENIKGEKCSTRDYGPNRYKAPCYECCLGCAGAINMECNFVCPKVAEHYHPSEED